MSLDFNSPYMGTSPFSQEQIRAYNRYSHFDVDINKGFNASIDNAENKVKNTYPDLDQAPENVKTALAYYRKSLYEWYLEHTRASHAAPNWFVVGPANNYKGNLQKAHKIEDKANEKLKNADKWIDKALMRSRKAENREATKNENNIKVGDVIKIWWTNYHEQYSSNATIEKINVKTMVISLHENNFGYPTGCKFTIPIICTPGNKWESLNSDFKPKTNKYLQSDVYKELEGKFKVGDKVYNTFYRFEGIIIKINKKTMVIKGEPTYSKDDGLRKVSIDETHNKKIGVDHNA
jgi:hypothetical protein